MRLVDAGIRCMLLRGGTSKGAFFLAEDLPVDSAARSDVLLRVMGSPDPTQIDGIGGAHPLTSKVAIVSKSSLVGVDVDYLFLQVVVDEPVVSDRQTCGNLLAGVGPFALERGLITADGDTARLRIRLVNTGDIADVTFPTDDGAPVYTGTTAIDGVPGRAAPIHITVSGGNKPLLPTGHLRDRILGHDVTLIDNGMPVVVLRASEFSVTGTESPEALEASTVLTAALEQIRLEAGDRFGFGDVSDQTVPKMLLVSPPTSDGALTVRAFIPKRVHTSLGVLMAASLAAAAQIPGTVGYDIAERPARGQLLIEHPTGAIASTVDVALAEDGVWHASSHSVRTARKLFDGQVFPRPATYAARTTS